MREESKYRLLETQGPVDDGGRKLNIIYFVLGALGFVFGLLMSEDASFGAGIFLLVIGLIVGWGIKTFLASIKLAQLRHMKFAIPNHITNDQLMSGLISTLIPLGMTVEKLSDGRPTINYQAMIYDVTIDAKTGDYFTIHWRRSIVRAFFGISGDITKYRKASVAYGIIGYNVQQISKNITAEQKEV